MPCIRLIVGLPAPLVVVNPFAEDRSRVLVLVDAGQPWRRILGMSRPILDHAERRELCRVLLAC